MTKCFFGGCKHTMTIPLGLKTRVQSQIIQQINFRIFDPNLLFKMGLNSGDQNIWKNPNCFNNVIFSRPA